MNLQNSSAEVFLRLQQIRRESQSRMPIAAAITAALLMGALALGASAGLAKEKKNPTKTVSGVVLNESENGIEGAMIEIVDAQTGQVFDIYSQQGGTYQFTDLLFSHDYTVKATFKGSSSEVRHVSSIDIRPRLVLNLTIPEPKH